MTSVVIQPTTSASTASESSFTCLYMNLAFFRVDKAVFVALFVASDNP
jgi:hypothetical protein